MISSIIPNHPYHFVFCFHGNIAGIIAFCIAFGILLSAMGERARVMIDFFAILADITMQMVILIMW